LDATGTRDDNISGRGLRLSWFSNLTGYLDSDGKAEVYLPLGSHRITLYADDGVPGHNVSISVQIEVYDPSSGEPSSGGGEDGSEENEDQGDITWMLAIIVLSILFVLGGIGYMILRRNRESEGQIGIRLENCEKDFNEDENT
jgi:hypothetical protein